MFEWKVEDMVLRRPESKKTIITRWGANRRYKRKEMLYVCESELSREDKISFVDKKTDGLLSYILGMIEKFEEAKESMPKDIWGGVKTVSLKAWLKKNDSRDVFDTEYSHGAYRILGVNRNIRDLNNYWEEGLFHDLADEVFHSQLVKCEKEEEKYFLEHDEYSILKEKFRNRNYHTTFGVHISTWSNGRITVNGDNDGEERDITMEELKDLLSKYEQLDALVEKLTAETDIKY